MILFLIGMIAGIVSGMGIGGGSILIPSLALFAHVEQHIAQSINLLFFIPTAIVALLVHKKNNKITGKTALPIVAAGLSTATLGSLIAVSLSSGVLKKFFGVFLLLMGIRELLISCAKKHEAPKNRN